MKRYQSDRTVSGNKLATHEATTRIRRAIELGFIEYREVPIREDQRLDHLAYNYLGNSDLWWVLAATSGIGWGLQVPAGTIIRVPLQMSVIQSLV